MTDELHEQELPEGYEVGDWAFDSKKDPAWDDPSILRRRVAADEYIDLADAIVRGASVAYCVIDDLRALVEAVQKHPDVLLSKLGDEDEKGITRTAGVFDKQGRPVDASATRLVLRGCLINEADLSSLDIGCTLECSSRFGGKAWFGEARFGAEAKFMFARFGDKADFWDARFGGEASFVVARFGGEAFFLFARFGGIADFEDACFVQSAEFKHTIFTQRMNFDGAHITGTVQIGDISIERSCSFGSDENSGTMLPARNDYRGDLRRADVRWVKLHYPDPPAQNDAKRLFHQNITKNIQSISWTLVRAIGELSILARVSFLALIFVPMLASAWPAIRVGVTGYNDSIVELSERFEDGAEALLEASGKLEGGIGESLIDEVNGVEESVQAWSNRFGRMTVDDQNLPLTMAFAFFAAAFVTAGQLVYQWKVPATIKKYDEEAFIEWMHGRYHDEALDRLDGLRRSCEYLKVITDQKPERNANFVKHHNEMIWIPPKDKIEWFKNVELADKESYPEGYVPAAERERIALEEGAKAEYWFHAQKSKGYARACFFAYAIGMILLGIILVLQGINVARAAGIL